MKQKLCKLLAVLLAVGMTNATAISAYAAPNNMFKAVVNDADQSHITSLDITNETDEDEDDVELMTSVITLNDKSKTYTGDPISIGKAIVVGSTRKVTYTYYTDKKCTVKTTTKADGAWSKGGAPSDTGTYYVIAHVKADENYDAATSNIAKLTIKKAGQDIDVDKTSQTWKDTYVKSSARTFNIDASATDGKITCEKISGSSALSIAKGGKVKIKKGTSAGSYTMKVKITAAATKNYKKATKTIKITVTIKKTTTKKDNNGGNSGTVYWVPSGEVYHSTKGCRSLSRSKTIYSGSVSQAKSAGKSRPCKNCY